MTVPMHDIIERQSSGKSDLLVFLMVYSGASIPLTRAVADKIRANLEDSMSTELGFDVAKRNRMVSKAFPFPLLDYLMAERID